MLKTALVLGATGLVGKILVEQLCLDPRYQTVTCLLRKPLSKDFFNANAAKVQPIVVDFENLKDYQGYFGCDHIYVCLGTTIKKAGSKSAFRKVDFEYVHIAAQLAKAQRAISFVWISAVGANAKSNNFYLRVKGELENAILNMSGLDNAAAVRPSLLLGEREEMRPAEKLASMLSPFLSPLLRGKLSKYKPVQAADVAAQMIRLQVF
ncbi:NAD(P)H-binding protein [Paraglaciecola arctica]|uniref:Oxidoreductase HTATIP2 n=1 Tax=Paraglaciecola arctica BSs20135 TaxID=493475 RepID=K6YQS1_9ALTE|nr:NAD(P)H-binding protein [Paraglaciecola arctica]GAC18988.1 oxidoreductase HTATIP2 [Paraglaciecola arctica BSs20135]